MAECLFCMIANHTLASVTVYEDDLVMAFEDINPQLPVHTLVIPKQHFDHIGDEVPEEILGHLFAVSAKIAELKGIDKTGYRMITNTGEDGRQTIHHLHVHVLGGAKLPIRMGPAD